MSSQKIKMKTLATFSLVAVFAMLGMYAWRESCHLDRRNGKL